MCRKAARRCARRTYPSVCSVRFDRPKRVFGRGAKRHWGGGFVALLMKLAGKPAARGTNREETGWVCSHEKKDNAPENRSVPRHIVVIMDGNGRWAKKRGLPRKAGHKVGAETFRTIATYCKDIGVQYFTVYAFSTENWKRPQDEVDALMNLFRSYLEGSGGNHVRARRCRARVRRSDRSAGGYPRADRGGGRDCRSAWSGRGNSLAVHQLRWP